MASSLMMASLLRFMRQAAIQLLDNEYRIREKAMEPIQALGGSLSKRKKRFKEEGKTYKEEVTRSY